MHEVSVINKWCYQSAVALNLICWYLSLGLVTMTTVLS